MLAPDMSTGLIWDVIWKTAFVLVLLYGVLWAIRRFSWKPMATRRGAGVSVVHTAQLGPGRSLHLVEIGNKLLLLGATSQQVSLLAELAASDLEPPTEVPAAESGSFEHCLSQATELLAAMSSRVRGRRQRAGLQDGENPGAGE